MLQCQYDVISQVVYSKGPELKLRNGCCVEPETRRSSHQPFGSAIVATNTLLCSRRCRTVNVLFQPLEISELRALDFQGGLEDTRARSGNDDCSDFGDDHSSCVPYAGDPPLIK